MKICTGIVAFCLLLFGCKDASEHAQIRHAVLTKTNESRFLSKGLARLTTAYTINNSQFNSTCSATLIHTPEAALNYCVAVTAAHCFQNIPKSAQHSIELIDRQGTVIKSYRATEVYLHPSFAPTDNQQTVEQAATDLALIEFKCSLPNGIQPSRVLDISQLPSDAFVTVASHDRLPEEKDNSDNFISGLLVPGRVKTPGPVARLLLRSLRVLSTDYPMSAKDSEGRSLHGVLSLEQTSSLTSCNGQSGAAAFYEHGNELFLVATASSGQGFCDGGNLFFTLTSPHAEWINKTMEHKLMVPAQLPENVRLTHPQRFSTAADVLQFNAPVAMMTPAPRNAIPSTTAPKPNATAAPKPNATAAPTANATAAPTANATAAPTANATAAPKPNATAAPKPNATAAATPTASVKRMAGNKRTSEATIHNLPTRVKPQTLQSTSVKESTSGITPPPLPTPFQNLPTAVPTVRKKTETVKIIEADDENESISEKPNARTLAEPTVPPIPPPPPEVVNSECPAVRMTAQSKSRVWGTVLKLIDKDPTLIMDDSLKCDFPNDAEICVVANPVATGTGHSRVVLSQGINFGGCDKFYSGRTVYLDAADFKILP